MKTFKPFVIIILIFVLGGVYVTVSNKINFYTLNTQKVSRKLDVQQKTVKRLQTDITDILASKAAANHMVKIPVQNIPEEPEDGGQPPIIKLASSK